MTQQPVPTGWKNYDDFAAGIDTNRLPQTDALVGRQFSFSFADGRSVAFIFTERNRVSWTDGNAAEIVPGEAIDVAPDTFFVDVTFPGLPTESEVLVFSTRSRHALSVRSIIRAANAFPGEPRVAQIFRVGVLDGATVAPTAICPAPTRDLVGLRAHFTYSPNHVYEHTYLSSERYCWQCLVGVQRGHGDVDLTTTYKFDDDQYVFTFREFKIPVASTFFYNFRDLRSTGTFLGITGDRHIENKPAGAHIRKASMTYYLPGQDPV